MIKLLTHNLIVVMSNIEDGIILQRLNRSCGFELSSSAHIIKGLEKKGLIRREKCGRTKNIYLTEVGVEFQKFCRGALTIWNQK